MTITEETLDSLLPFFLFIYLAQVVRLGENRAQDQGRGNANSRQTRERS